MKLWEPGCLSSTMAQEGIESTRSPDRSEWDFVACMERDKSCLY